MNRVKLHTCFLLLLSLTLLTLSCTKKEVKEFGEYEEVSIDRMDMLVRGNCMPIELEGVSVHSIIQVTDEKITDLTFLTSNEIACITEEGKVFLVEIEPNDVDQITDFNVSTYSWKILAHNQEEFLTRGFLIKTEPEHLESYMIAVIHNEEGIYWSTSDLTLPSRWVFHTNPFYDGKEYMLMDRDLNNNISFHRLLNNGKTEIAAGYLGNGRSLYPQPDNSIIYWFSSFSGPYYSMKTDSGFTRIMQWNPGWNRGFNQQIVINSEKIIGMLEEGTERGMTGCLAILDKAWGEPEIIRFDYELDLDIFSDGDWGFNYNCASNGDTIVFTTAHYIIKYTEGELIVWHSNLDEYTDGQGVLISSDTSILDFESNTREYFDSLYIRELIVDINCDNFLILLSKTILFGGNEINSIDLNSQISTDIQFTPDFQRACLALEDGSIVVLNIEGTPVDQN